MDHTEHNGNHGNHSNGLAASQQAAAQARERLLAELQQAITQAEAWLDQTPDSGGPGHPSEAQARFASALDAARADLGKLEQALLARGRNAAGAAGHYVQQHPWQAIGLGAASGVILGMLLTRK